MSRPERPNEPQQDTTGAAGETDASPYARLRRLRRRRKLAAIVLVCAPPSFFALGVVLDGLGVPAPETDYIVFGGLLAAWALVVSHLFARCPRCRRFFYIATIGYVPVFGVAFARRCTNCKLSLQSRLVLDESNLATLREWHGRTDEVGPLPDVGLCCPVCGYSLTGLTERRCPECAAPFDLEDVLRQ